MILKKNWKGEELACWREKAALEEGCSLFQNISMWQNKILELLALQQGGAFLQERQTFNKAWNQCHDQNFKYFEIGYSVLNWFVSSNN